MSVWKGFSRSKSKPLPVILLCDVSGSMSVQGKIAALNQSVREMIASFADEQNPRSEIHVGIITFGGIARLHAPLQPAAQVQWEDMQADGGTPMGQALGLAAELIEDKNQVPSASYRPAVVLVTDGQPTDDWRSGFHRLQQGRGAKAERFAMGIGADADLTMLQAFLADPARKVFRAEDAHQVRSFFKFVTMSVSARSQSADPNVLAPIQDPDDIVHF